jgi:hypothetical protein
LRRNGAATFQNVSVRLIEGALEKPVPLRAWMRLECPWSRARANTPLLQAVQAADFASGVAPDRRHARMDLHQSRDQPVLSSAPEGEWILIRSRTRAGANGAGLTHGEPERSQGRVCRSAAGDDFERRAAQAQAS